MKPAQEKRSVLYERMEALLNKAGEAFDNDNLQEANDAAKEAIDLYEDKGEPEDCRRWAAFANYIVGRYMEEEMYDGTMAWFHYQQATELGYAAAYTELGQLYYDGNGATPDGEPDVNEALACWQAGMEEGIEECAERYEAHKHEYLPEVEESVETDTHEGHHYVGQVDDEGRPHGVGKMEYKKQPYKEWMKEDVSIETYEGHFEHGKRCGYGRAKFYKNGFGSPQYSGNWRDDLPDGQGRYESYGGVTDQWYEGQWKAGRRHGQGRYHEHWDKNTFPTYDYEGRWVDDKEEGQGSASWAAPYSHSTPSTYEGQWKGGQKHGHGKMTYESGNTLEGEWHNGHLQGRGVYTCADGLRFSAVWNENGLDAATIEANGGQRFLCLRLHRHGFDYNNSATALVQVRKGQVKFRDCLTLSGGRAFGQDDLLLTIRDIRADGTVGITVPALFARDSKPMDDSISPGETREYKDVQQCTATIYGDEHHYETEHSMTVEYADTVANGAPAPLTMNPEL